MITKNVNRNVWRVQPYIPGKPIEEVKRELGLNEVIKLASNENPFGPSPKILKAIARAAKTLNRYPDGQCFYLRRELAKRLKVSPDELIFGNGSDEIIVLTVRAFVEPGDEVVVARPSFLIYEMAAKLAGAVVKGVSLKNLYYDLEGMHRAVSSRTKIIFIGNPDNPAGTYVTQGQVKDFLGKVPSDVIVFFDEAYYEYVLAKDYPKMIKFLKQHKNVIVTRTFSKMYGLAGLRIGYGIADKALANVLERVREPFNVNSLAQAAALACLKSQRYYQRIARLTQQQKEFLYQQLKAQGITFYKSATNFILMDMKRDATAIAQKFLRQGVVVRDMAAWGLNHFIRVTVGTERENKRFLAVLKEVV